MKKIHIVGILMIIAAIVMISTASDDLSTYANFETARHSNDLVKIAGVLSKDKEMQYDPAIDPNYFSFFVKDDKGEERKVVLYGSKPQDFELSEQIVITGKMKGEEFIASDMLLKCPSKYKDEEIYIKGAEKES